MPIRSRVRRPTNPSLTALVAAGGVSAIGDWAYLTALPILVYQRTGDIAAVGAVEALRLIPFFLLSVPAGALADRFPKRPLLILTEVVRGLAMVALAGLCMVDAPVALIVATAMLAAAAGTLSMPVHAALIPEIATSDAELGRANATSSTLESVACVVGPAVTAALILVGGIVAAFLVNATSFGVVVAALFVFRPTTAAADREQGSAPLTVLPRIGWLEIVRRIAPWIAVDGAVSIVAGALAGTTILVAVEVLGATEALAAMLAAAGGVGGVCGGLIARVAVGRAGTRAQGAGAILTSVALVGLMLVPTAWAAALLIAIAMGTIIVLDTLTTTAVQAATRDGATGRAVGLMHGLTALWMTAGAVGVPLLAAIGGVAAALGALALVVAVLGVVSIGMDRPRRRDPVPVVRESLASAA